MSVPLAAAADQAEPSQCWIASVPPTAHTSSGALPQIPPRYLGVLLGTVDQAEPFQCSMTPASPPAHTSFGPLPHTQLSCWGDAVVTGDHAVPSQCRMMLVPAAVWSSRPTVQASFGPLPHSPRSERVVPLGTEDQAAPFQCWMVPLSPAAQTSSGPLPQTASRSLSPVEGRLAAHQASEQGVSFPPPHPPRTTALERTAAPMATRAALFTPAVEATPGESTGTTGTGKRTRRPYPSPEGRRAGIFVVARAIPCFSAPYVNQRKTKRGRSQRGRGESQMRNRGPVQCLQGALLVSAALFVSNRARAEPNFSEPITPRGFDGIR